MYFNAKNAERHQEYFIKGIIIISTFEEFYLNKFAIKDDFYHKVGNASIQIEYSVILFPQNNGLPYDISS